MMENNTNKNPLEILHETVGWIHSKRHNLWEALELYISQQKRLNQPIYDSRVPSDVSVIPYIVNYNNRRHIYAYNNSGSNIVLNDILNEFNITLLPFVWNLIAVPNGTQLYAETSSTFQVLCTDEILFSPPSTTGVAASILYADTWETATSTGPTLGVSVSLPAIVGKTVICYGFTITAAGGLNAAWASATLTDGIKSMVYQYAQTNGGNGSDMFHCPVLPGLKAANTNSAITLTVAPVTSGGTVTVSIYGAYI